MENSVKFEQSTFGKRLKSMLKVDFRRMFKSRLFYILIACALLVPIVMVVMMTMMDGSVSVDPQTGVETVMQGPENAWQSIGTLPTEDGAAMGGMDVMAMCNINMAFMGVAVFVCLFISDDFRSGYAKNLFTVRSKKGDYVISKTLAGFVCVALMLIAYFIGAMLGGAISGLSFELAGGLTAANIVFCMLAKIFLMLVFVSIFTLISVVAKQRAWLAICGSLGGGMLLFMMVSMITPLESTIMNVFLCIAGGAMFAFGLGAISNVVLKKTSLV
ncbi:MAG: ABC transporter permease [Clostridia bacterium]|nr:ABC transporter permease [Clostridia bacterium]